MESLSEELMSFESLDGEELNEGGNLVNKIQKAEYKVNTRPGFADKAHDTTKGPNKLLNRAHGLLKKNPHALDNTYR